MALFSGCSNHQLDDKARLILPRRILDRVAAAEQEFTLTAGPEGCLLLLPTEEWKRFVAPHTTAVIGSRRERMRRRLILGHSEAVAPDKTGRLVLPEALRNYAGITASGEVWLVGLGKTVELWNPERWAEQLAACWKDGSLFDDADNPKEDDQVAVVH
jgi:MraZ protein